MSNDNEPGSVWGEEGNQRCQIAENSVFYGDFIRNWRGWDRAFESFIHNFAHLFRRIASARTKAVIASMIGTARMATQGSWRDPGGS